MWLQESYSASGELDIHLLKDKECTLSGGLAILVDRLYPGGEYHETIQHEVRWELEEK